MFYLLQPLSMTLALAMAFATVADGPPPPPPSPTSTPSPPPPPPPPPAGYDPHAVMRDPTVRRMDPPVYPPEENCRGIGGEVLLQLDYDRRGAVVDVRVIRSSGNRNLDRAAVESAKQWTVNPGTRDGLPIAGSARVPVKFEPAADLDCRRPQIDTEAAPGEVAQP